jgi:hypothetical protein
VPFDPATLPAFTVFLQPYRFENVTIRKIFILICHENKHAFCIKTTSNSEFYKNSLELMAGCVCYKAGEHQCFGEDTYVQPDNQFAIPYVEIGLAEANGGFKIIGIMPNDFKEKLIKAVTASATMNARKKARIPKAIQG